MMRAMIFGTGQTFVRLRCLTHLGLVFWGVFVAVTCVSAQVFEEIADMEDARPARTLTPKRLIQTEGFVPQPLPAIASPDDANGQRQATGIIQPVGGATPDNGVILAQYQDTQYQSDAEWASSKVTLPSVQLAQGSIPRLASIEKTSPQTSTYQGPGRIITDESDGMTPTITTRPSTKLPEPPPIPRAVTNSSGIVNAYSQADEIEWDDTQSIQNYGTYETLPRQLNRGYSSAYTSEDLYGIPEYSDIYGNPYTGNLYGQGISNDGMYAANGYYGYGQGMYGYGGYPGARPPTHGLVSGVFSHILCSNAWENLTISFGGTGFKSPLEFQNGGTSGGAFGFTETLNWASPSTSMLPVRFQAGVRAIQAYPSGWDDGSAWRRNTRDQYFGTFGVFKRNIGCTPFSLGAVYDAMSDEYYDKYKLEQLRAELSYGTMYGVEFGYRGAFGMRNDSVWLHNRHANVNQRVGVRVVDYHTLFIKKYFANCGEGSLAGGATEFGDFIVRAEYGIPLSNEWALKNSLSYLVPRGGHSHESPSRESWDVSLQLVYQPQGGMLAGFCNPFRAFFDVADNGTLLRRFK
ncbi:MAG: hypothetical protein FWH27_12395 [Planctomycetaceae bacterium]|nr:hypothetical protein [Planctomycetaceae bacterium]